MGFRDIHCFNLALLAKQCWRLLDQSDSLCARVLKAKYYPEVDILKVNLKKGSSYVWQSIWAGVQTFKKGCIWRVGDGMDINIWEDCWIPNGPDRKITTRRGNIVLIRVHELIYPITGSWDEELIRANFWNIDVQRIMQIPLPRHDISDFVAWHHSKSGRFSVKYAYYVEWEAQYGDKLRSVEGQGTAYLNPVWKGLWSLRVLAKVKKNLVAMHEQFSSLLLYPC